MDIKLIIELIGKLEADDSLPYTQYLTDGDEDDLHPAVKAVLEAFEFAPEYCERKEMELAGYKFLSGVDCWCFSTKKGIVNTGHDRF
ncbi:hypothetical protein D3C78_301880 [compost metagenome]